MSKRKPEENDLGKNKCWEYEFKEFDEWADRNKISEKREEWLPCWKAWQDGYSTGYNA